MELKISETKKIDGQIQVPGDKSISHRAVMLGSLSKGTTTVTNFLTGADCLSTIACFRAMGAKFEQIGENSIVVRGNGLTGLKEPADVLDVGNSGTTIRLMLGILSGQKFFSAVTGDNSIRRRPMGRVTGPLREMGAQIWGRQEGSLAPLAIQGGNLNSIDFNSTVASAQVKSAILLAGLYASGETTVNEPLKSRDHTERMLSYLGARVDVEGNTVKISGHPELEGKPVEVPGDISSAAFFMVAAAITPGSVVRLNRVGINPTRTGIIDVLLNMGANINIINQDEVNGEPVADIVVNGTGELKGTVIEGDIIPRLIDEIPVISVAAALAKGETIVRDAKELRVKETDRIATMTAELAKMGVEIIPTDDGMVINGEARLKGAVCESHDDHRIAMALAIAGLRAKGETVIRNSGCVDISFPGFSQKLKQVLT